MQLVAVLLAAGGGTRFAGPTHKLVAPLDGRPVVRHALDHALASGVGTLIVVTGAVDLHDHLGLSATDPTERAGAIVHVHNEHWSDGQATSIRLAAAAADQLGADAMMIGLGDQPFVSAAAWRRVAAEPTEHHIVVASYDGRRGPHPVRLHRSLWAELPFTGDDGARTVIREHPALVHEVPCPGSAADIDTLEDLHRWTSS